MTLRVIIWKMKMTEMTALEVKRKKRITKEEDELEAAIPRPVGYRVLIALPNIEDTFGMGEIVKASGTKHEEYVLSIIGLVIDMGSEAYADKERFATGPWCKQ